MKLSHTRLALLAIGLTASGAVAAPIAVSAQATVTSTRQLEIVKHIAPAGGPPKSSLLSAYLMVYFKDETHSLHFAVSRDGYSFTDVNDGRPVLNGREIAEQKGIRDPHIVRGPDGAFYLAMTDLHIFAKREGLRATDWERPAEAYGWGNNRAMIFMKSYDLVHWTHSIVRVDKLFPETANIGTAWAPETIYDPSRKQMMVYYSTHDGKETDHMAYAYADDDFTTLTTVPKSLFTYPKAGINTIDGDITKVGDKYHLFYVAHDKPGYIRQAVSTSLNAGFVYDPAKVDPEQVGTEAPTLWKRHGTDTYVLMYDVFGAKPNNMGFSETRDFVHFTDIGHFNDPGSPMKSTNFSQPKHGAVIPISVAEMECLMAWFNSGKQE